MHRGLPYGYPIHAITSPRFSDSVGGSLLGVVNLLWDNPILEVREACFAAIRKAEFREGNSKAFQGNSQDLLNNHKKIQETVGVLLQIDPDMAVSLIKEYLKFSHAGYTTDMRHEIDEAVQGRSRKLHVKAMRFATQLLVVKHPKCLQFAKLECNTLYLHPALFHVLVQIIERDRVVGWDADLFLLAASRMLSRMTRESWISEEGWKLFECLYRYVIESFGRLSYDPPALRPRLQKIAQGVLKDQVRFIEDPVFGDLLAGRAKKVCTLFLEHRK